MTGFSFEDGWLDFPCPRGKGNCSIPIKPEVHPNTGASWNINDMTQPTTNPTVTPSINCGGCGWHGWIRDGKAVEA